MLPERPKNPKWRSGNPQRVWGAARAKVRSEGRCRRCHGTYRLEAAHIIPRSRVGARRGAEDSENIVPLCAGCHSSSHAGLWELGPFLSPFEFAHAVGLVGEGEAERRLFPSRFRQGEAA
jgi:hypothetical protein